MLLPTMRLVQEPHGLARISMRSTIGDRAFRSFSSKEIIRSVWAPMDRMTTRPSSSDGYYPSDCGMIIYFTCSHAPAKNTKAQAIWN
jgi:hypothetical protein